MKTLTIETSSKMCGVSILEDKTLLQKIELNNGLTHSESLMPIINDIFLKTNLHLKDINLIVCDIGPGSFTGIRIGVATTKAFLDSLNIKSIGISSLEALAYNINEDNLICSLIDAKNNSCYYALYKLEENKYKEIIEPAADNLDNIISILNKYKNNIIFVGDGAVNYKDIIIKSIETAIIADDNEIHSYNLGLAGINKYFSSTASNELLPLYLRKPQAERQLEEKLNAHKKDSDKNV